MLVCVTLVLVCVTLVLLLQLRRMQSVVKDRDSQYKHEIKKKGREIDRLMERLHQVIVDKTPQARIGIQKFKIDHF